ncbi:inositol-pentakisphosphate 2-kinase-domain-containing protein [Lineolata rhizophorae]|uniref:Inositol-pentakisphosphate 2-kinase n=1 Tax=Lineolata rhizophorae TaxID=578093 RepID=A0A6A6NYJ1_9PEZI|nr:inositol-pentakisphosphate 2-kinase-domain-containing protein [Lineolata rhizophorae]
MSSAPPNAGNSLVDDLHGAFADNTIWLDRDVSPSVPASFIRFQYLSEGGANVLLSLSPDLSGGKTGYREEHKPLLEGKLLRLRKAVRGFITAKDIFRFHQSVIQYFFSADEVVEYTLLRVNNSFLAVCNENLQRLAEHQLRTADRTDGCLIGSQDDFISALFVTDMTSHFGPTPDPRGVAFFPTAESSSQRLVTVEFKPKWLIQSPTAPQKARRCRTCALRAKRQATKHRSSDKEFCPLALVDSKGPSAHTLAESIVRAQAYYHELDPAQLDHLTKMLSSFIQYERTNDRLLQKLKNLQMRLSHPLSRTRKCEDVSDILISMTLRDCSLLIRFDIASVGGEHVEPEAKLADLDFKSHGLLVDHYCERNSAVLVETVKALDNPKLVDHELRAARDDLYDRLRTWSEAEEHLIRAGWYTGDENCKLDREICVLWKERDGAETESATEPEDATRNRVVRSNSLKDKK